MTQNPKAPRINDLLKRLRALSLHEHDDLDVGEEAADFIEQIIDEQSLLENTDEPLSANDRAMINDAWETHKAAIPVAVILNDNQPGRTAIIQILCDPPTLVVGTELFAKRVPAARTHLINELEERGEQD